MGLSKEKKDMILGIIAVRLDNVKDVTRRSRLAFLITTIASCAIIITIWGVYFSTARNVALYDESNSVLTNPILPLHEYNRRELIKEWIKNTNVSIDLLGVEVNINDFPFVGSLGLFVICFWLFFTFRRENRAIVSLLRDVKNDLDFPMPNQKKGDDVWDIANLAFHGVANSLIFFTTGTNDKPLSYRDIFEEDQSNLQKGFDSFIAGLTKLIRKLVMILIFLPALTIGLMIWADEYSTYNIKSPFRAVAGKNLTPAEYMKNNGAGDMGQITIENGIGVGAGILTLLICIACFIFQKRTSDSLKKFEEQLNNETESEASNNIGPKQNSSEETFGVPTAYENKETET